MTIGHYQHDVVWLICITAQFFHLWYQGVSVGRHLKYQLSSLMASVLYPSIVGSHTGQSFKDSTLHKS